MPRFLVLNGWCVAVSLLGVDMDHGRLVGVLNTSEHLYEFFYIVAFLQILVFEAPSLKPVVLACTPRLSKGTKLGMARTFQNIRLWKSQTVFDNVLIAKHCRTTSNVFSATFRLNRKEEKEQREEVMKLLEIVGLADVKDELATSLPYGKQRRLEIARALAAEPQLLLLDEPAAGMNPQETDELTAFIGEIRDKFHLTVFLIEHHMNLVMGISDRIYVLDFGKLIAEGTPAEIQNNKRVIDAYLGVADDA